MTREQYMQDKNYSQNKEILAENIQGEVTVNDGMSMVESPTHIMNQTRKFSDSYTVSHYAQSTAPTANPNYFQPMSNIEEPTSPSRFKLGCYKQSQCLDPPKRQKHCTSPILPRQNVYLSDAKRMKTMRPSNYVSPILGSS